MFDGLSSSYDKANRFISLGMDMRWKKRLVKMLVRQSPQSILDLATGTADLPLMMAEKGLSGIVGLDLSAGMLAVGQERVIKAQKEQAISLVQGDSENLPFPDQSFDAVTVSYGLRNYENLERGLQETYRVMKPGASFLILETSVPHQSFLRPFYALFTRGVMPMLGRLFSGNAEAYRYLSKSAAAFPCGQEMCAILQGLGFEQVIVKQQFFGAASIYFSRKGF